MHERLAIHLFGSQIHRPEAHPTIKNDSLSSWHLGKEAHYIVIASPSTYKHFSLDIFSFIQHSASSRARELSYANFHHPIIYSPQNIQHIRRTQNLSLSSRFVYRVFQDLPIIMGINSAWDQFLGILLLHVHLSQGFVSNLDMYFKIRSLAVLTFRFGNLTSITVPSLHVSLQPIAP